MSDSDESVKKKEEDDDSSSDFDTMKQSKRKSLQRLKESDDEGSSSDSSVGDYLKKANEIDLNSSFFTTAIVPKVLDFATVKKSVQRLSEFEDSDDEIKKLEIVSETKINFTQLRDYNKKIEETKACVAKYEKTKKEKKKEKRQDIKRLLSLGEKNEPISVQSDFDDSDNDMDWQEIAESIDKSADKITIPKDGVQITVELPNVVKKKSKGIDIMAAIKRRINKIKKDHQVDVHKVHLLCWLAHGNYINSVLNSENLLGLALSLLPSDKCYPPKHADMSYLEQICAWYRKVMTLQETVEDFNTALSDALSNQISKKVARSKTNFIYIFIIILRSLGLQCRVVLSFQCLPLRPANSELCPLSTKDNKEGGVINDKNKTKKTSNKPSTSKADSKKTSTVNNKNKGKVKSKTLQIPQVEGAVPKEKNTGNNKDKIKIKTLRIPQLDGADDDEPSTSKPKRNKLDIKLKKNLDDSTSSSSDFLKPQTRLESSEKHRKRHLSQDQSDHDFKSKRFSPEKSPKDINKVKTSADKNKNIRTRENKELSLKSKLENNLASSEENNNKNEQSVMKQTAQKRNLKDESSMDHKKGRSDVRTTKNTTENKRLNLKSKLESNVTSAQETIKNINVESGLKRTVRNRNLKNVKSVALEIIDESSMGCKNGRSNIATTKNTPQNKRLNLKTKLGNNATSTQETVNKNEESIVRRTARKRNVKEHIKSVASKSADETSKSRKRTASNTKVENKPSTFTTSPTKVRRSNVINDIVGLIKGQMSLKRDEEKSRLLRRPGKKIESDYDSDYFPDEDIELPSTSQRSVNKKYDSADEFKYKVKRRVRPRSELEAKMLSDEDADKKKKGNDVWIEVFLEEEEKWISVDLINGQVHCVKELHVSTKSLNR